MKPLFCLLSLALLLTLIGCGTNLENLIHINADLAQANNSAANGNTTKAKYWCDQAIAVDPTALSTYVTTSQAASDQPAKNIAAIFSSVDDDLTLRDYMRQAAKRFPTRWEPQVFLVEADGNLGDSAAQKSDATQEAALLEQAIRRPGQTHDENLMLSLAQAYCTAGNYAKGVSDYRAVIQAFPKDSDPYNGLAYNWALEDSKPDLPQALLYAHKALLLAQRATPQGNQTQDDVDMNIAMVQDTLAWVQYRMGDFKDALSNLQTVLSTEPTIAESHYHLGMVYLALKEPDAAHVEFHQALQLEPDLAAAQAAIAPLDKNIHAPPGTPDVL
jgi:tetratricopeptide (TPR) repeat protein